MSNTVIGTSFVIDGEISCNEDLVIHGTVKGRVQSSERIEVGNSAIVQADLDASAIEIEGQVTGNVAASDRVTIQSDGRVIGDIRSPRFTIAEGACFKGSVDME